MGCFDTVIARCPECRERIELQTKAGKCDFTTYWLATAPAEIAGSLHGETVECPCGCASTIHVQTIATIQPRIISDFDYEDD